MIYANVILISLKMYCIKTYKKKDRQNIKKYALYAYFISKSIDQMFF